MNNSIVMSDVDIQKNGEFVVSEDNKVVSYKRKPVYSFFKRLFDITVSFISLIILSPLFLIVAVLVSLSDGKGKPFFVQKRCGKNGKLFNVYKFRTMCVDAEEKKESLKSLNEMDGPAFKIQDDPRITKIGKILRATNIDELPQILNILKGDMSFVGPRPPLPDEVDQYNEIDKQRLLVTPGLTCYWQVSLNRNDIPFSEWMALDRKYIEDRSMLVDIKLIFKTVYVVLRHHDGR